MSALSREVAYSPLTYLELVERAKAADGTLAATVVHMVRNDCWDDPYWRAEITKLAQESDAWWSVAGDRARGGLVRTSYAGPYLSAASRPRPADR